MLGVAYQLLGSIGRRPRMWSEDAAPDGRKSCKLSRRTTRRPQWIGCPATAEDRRAAGSPLPGGHNQRGTVRGSISWPTRAAPACVRRPGSGPAKRSMTARRHRPGVGQYGVGLYAGTVITLSHRMPASGSPVRFALFRYALRRPGWHAPGQPRSLQTTALPA